MEHPMEIGKVCGNRSDRRFPYSEHSASIQWRCRGCWRSRNHPGYPRSGVERRPLRLARRRRLFRGFEIPLLLWQNRFPRLHRDLQHRLRNQISRVLQLVGFSPSCHVERSRDISRCYLLQAKQGCISWQPPQRTSHRTTSQCGRGSGRGFCVRRRAVVRVCR
jgi:hypothetical protein